MTTLLKRITGRWEPHRTADREVSLLYVDVYGERLVILIRVTTWNATGSPSFDLLDSSSQALLRELEEWGDAGILGSEARAQSKAIPNIIFSVADQTADEFATEKELPLSVGMAGSIDGDQTLTRMRLTYVDNGKLPPNSQLHITITLEDFHIIFQLPHQLIASAREGL